MVPGDAGASPRRACALAAVEVFADSASAPEPGVRTGLLSFLVIWKIIIRNLQGAIDYGDSKRHNMGN